MLGDSTDPRDFSYDRGFLIAKGTTLRRGEAYAAVLIPGTLGVAYGVNDRLTLQAGAVPWTLIGKVVTAFGSARYGVVRAEPFYVAVGAFAIAAIDNDEALLAGWPYVVATAGTPVLAVTWLAGLGSSTSIFEDDFDGDILLQGMAEAVVARGLKVIGEGLYLGDGSDPVTGTGLRFFGARHLFELGVLRAFGGTASTCRG